MKEQPTFGEFETLSRVSWDDSDLDDFESEKTQTGSPSSWLTNQLNDDLKQASIPSSEQIARIANTYKHQLILEHFLRSNHIEERLGQE